MAQNTVPMSQGTPWSSMDWKSRFPAITPYDPTSPATPYGDDALNISNWGSSPNAPMMDPNAYNSLNTGNSFGSMGNAVTPGLDAQFGNSAAMAPQSGMGMGGANGLAEPGWQNGWGFSATKDGMGNMSSGWGSPMAQLGTAGMNAYLGYQQLGVAKDSLAFQKDAFSKQFENQRTLTNARLRDRQLARDSATGKNTTGAYMAQNGV